MAGADWQEWVVAIALLVVIVATVTTSHGLH